MKMKYARACLCAAISAIVFSCSNAALAPTLSAAYDEGASGESYDFKWSAPSEAYLTRLRTEFSLDALVAGAANDTERAEKVCAWVHGLWPHDGSNVPAQSDPIFIIRQAQAGAHYRCVEYGIVVSGCLNALGIKARVLGIQTKDAETRKYGAGHVVAEAYLPDRGKWVFIDGQFGAIPFSGTTPLSGIEFKAALANGDPKLEIWSTDPGDIDNYRSWISDYLYFFTDRIDNRVGDSIADRDNRRLILVPVGDRAPMILYLSYPMTDYISTHSAAAFYAPPAN
jgi:hypothetical protein